jgi:soluble lytic murein transglycosylase
MRQLTLLYSSFLKIARRQLLPALAVLVFYSAAYAQQPQKPLGTLAGMPQGSYTLAQLNHFFDAASLHMRTAVESARGWLKVQPSHFRALRETLSSQPRAQKLSRTSVVTVPTPAPAYQRKFTFMLNHIKVTDRYDDLILKYAARYNLDPRLVKSIIAAESDFFAEAVSPAGALGLMQVMPKTARVLFQIPQEQFPEGRLTNPEFNILAGTAFLNELFRTAYKRYKIKGAQFINAPAWLVQRVIAAYNAGTRFLFRDHWYRETRHYVQKVILFYRSKVTKIPRVVDVNASVGILPTTMVAGSGSFF